MKRRVVVTGLGIVTPLGYQLDQVWQRILAGESGIHRLQIVDTSDFKVQIGGDVLDWDPVGYLEPKDMKRIDRFTQFAIVAGTDAAKHAQIDWQQCDRHRCGVILGSGIGGLGEIERQMIRMVDKGPGRVSPMTVPRMMVNAAAANLAIEFGLHGTNYTVTTACASATNAIGEAFHAVRNGLLDVVVTGGTEAAICRMSLAAFQNIRALSRRNDEPTRASRPFDADRDGFVFSEGAGILIFETLEHAQARGAPILAEVLGYGSSCDALHITQPDESGHGPSLAMKGALDDAALPPADVDYINAHGTSTPLGDIAETRAIKQVFGDHARQLSISSTKSQVGHSLGASGGVELVVTIQAITEDLVPPTINLDTPDPDCDLDYTPHEPRRRSVRVAMSNSFGFGGHNASVIVAKFDPDRSIN